MQALWMLMAALCFGTMGLLIKLAAQWGASLAEIILFRGAIPLLLLTGWALATGRSLESPASRVHLKRNVFGITAMWCGFYATTQLPLATAVTLMYTSPLFIAILLRYVYKQKNSLAERLCILIGFVGVLAVLRPVLNSEDLVVALIGLAGGAVAALAYLSLKQLGTMKEPEWRTVLYFAATATVSGIVAGLALGGYPSLTQGWASWQALAALIGLGFFGGAGNLALTRSFGAGSTWLSASLQYSTILVSTAYGIWIFGDHPEPATWAGVVLIMACGVLSSVAARKRARDLKALQQDQEF